MEKLKLEIRIDACKKHIEKINGHVNKQKTIVYKLCKRVYYERANRTDLDVMNKKLIFCFIKENNEEVVFYENDTKKYLEEEYIREMIAHIQKTLEIIVELEELLKLDEEKLQKLMNQLISS